MWTTSVANPHWQEFHHKLVLINESGRKWKAVYRSKETGGKIRNQIGEGWRAFVLANDVQEGELATLLLHVYSRSRPIRELASTH